MDGATSQRCAAGARAARSDAARGSQGGSLGWRRRRTFRRAADGGEVAVVHAALHYGQHIKGPLRADLHHGAAPVQGSGSAETGGGQRGTDCCTTRVGRGSLAAARTRAVAVPCPAQGTGDNAGAAHPVHGGQALLCHDGLQRPDDRLRVHGALPAAELEVVQEGEGGRGVLARRKLLWQRRAG